MPFAKATAHLLVPLSLVSAALFGCSGAQAAGQPCSLTLSSDSQPVTGVLQQAIDQCSLQGGGTVTLPAGVWISGPLQLKSHVTLHLAANSVLQSTGRPSDFTPAFISQQLRPREALIIASHVSDIGLTGPGTLDGQGQRGWWPVATEARNHLKQGDSQWFSQHWPGIPAANGMPRPWLIEFDHVQGARINQLRVINSPMWNVVLRNSKNIVMTNSSVTNPPDSPNTDGVDIVSSQNVTLRHLTLSTGDDDISVKSGLAGTGEAAASSNITISDIDVLRGHGISVGSETANGIGRITLHNLTFTGTDNGLRIKSGRDRGNCIGPLIADHLKMSDVHVPLVITDSYGGNGGYSADSISAISPKPVTRYTPFIHDISVNHLTATGADSAGIISGLPEALLKNISLKNIKISAHHGLQSRYVEGIRSHVDVTTLPHVLPWQQGPESHWTAS
ncbi:glycoside hydrolase family 28 protein [Tatumella citrea]|uniref:Glycoside hydrolase n=1 Tax=Tatumella citrea TaxID=53336 RepID=A0A1Y0LNV2_TATCI|nr:glycosyl hydrolase family 28 protein [Tatumella citrea]ARU95670.1 glycoside hydrolase [Tatumella citrea]ARU99711.1 glycoside hydrolase [Tatumella citrea]